MADLATCKTFYQNRKGSDMLHRTAHVGQP
ncbi:hypothetical protein J2857_005995 [Neorhizobium galegae]|nr:hypothetical protein [Neorhizobium galegae]